MEQGFIKLHRSILKWEWYDDANTMRVFLHLLLNANWEDCRYRGHLVPKGSLVIGRKKIAKEFGRKYEDTLKKKIRRNINKVLKR